MQNNYNIKKYNENFENDEMVNLEVYESKTKENIFKNNLAMYSIYILSRYYNACDRIGISNISIYDKK